MMTTQKDRAILAALGYAGGLALIWVVAASARPSTTFHLAPLLVAVTLPVVLGSDNASLHFRRLAGGAAGGAGLALLITLVLTMADRLQGPSLLPAGGAVTEAVVFSFAGAIGGFLFLLWRARGATQHSTAPRHDQVASAVVFPAIAPSPEASSTLTTR